MSIERQRGTIARLRIAADWLEAHPQPEGTFVFLGGNEDVIYVKCRTAEAFRQAIRTAAGHKKKSFDDKDVEIVMDLTDGVRVKWYIEREQVCRKIVTKETLPAQPEQVIPARPEREVEKVTWECPDSLLASTIEREQELIVEMEK